MKHNIKFTIIEFWVTCLYHYKKETILQKLFIVLVLITPIWIYFYYKLNNILKNCENEEAKKLKEKLYKL